MLISLPILHHPKYGFAIDRNRMINAKEIYKIRDEGKRDYCTYLFEDRWFDNFYDGSGLWFDPLIYPEKIWKNKNRVLNHKGDMLCSVVDETWTCRILCTGLTQLESLMLEAYLIEHCGKPLSTYGAKEWDRKSMINKKHPDKKIVDLIPMYLDLSDGDYNRLIA